MILVSACLIGIKCKYDGGNNLNEKVMQFLKDKEFVPICPEQLGGLETPRKPAEIEGEKVIRVDGEDVTAQFTKGAEEALKIAKLCNCDLAILKERSPSCGSNFIYDGTHSGTVKEGNGVTVRLFRANGILVMNEEEV